MDPPGADWLLPFTVHCRDTCCLLRTFISSSPNRYTSSPSRSTRTNTYCGNVTCPHYSLLILITPQLERTLKCWLTGEYVAPAHPFSSKVCGKDTKVWITGIKSYSVSRWKRLLAAVEELSTTATRAPSVVEALPNLANDPRVHAPPSSGSFYFTYFGLIPAAECSHRC